MTKDDLMMNEPKQDRSRATQAKLLDTTIRIISTRGLAATTVSLVAEEAGVSRGATQHHFPTREVLIREAVQQVAEERTQLLRDKFAELADKEPSDREILARVFDYFTDDLFHAAVHIWTGATSDEDLRTTILAAEAKSSREIYKATAQALRADMSDAHTREIIRGIMDNARGAGLSTMLVDRSERLETALDTLADLISNPVTGIKRLPASQPASV